MEISHGRHMDLPTVGKGPLPFSRIEQIVERRRIHHAGGYFPFFFESNERGKKGNATDKILSTVDRINDPTGVDAARTLTKFFTKEAAVRKGRAQNLDNSRLAFAVRPRHWRVIGLGLDRQVRTEIMQGNLTSCPGCSDSRVEDIVHPF